jgi:hypothetical protein
MRVQIGKLDRAIREDLYNMHAMFNDPDAVESHFYRRYVNVVEIDLSSINKKETYKLMSEESMKQYLGVLGNEETKYGVVADNKLLDGMHRITSLLNDSQNKMLAVDLSGLINVKSSGFICDATYSKFKPIKKSKMSI